MKAPEPSKPIRTATITAILVCLLATSWGCGTGAYEERMNRTLQELRNPSQEETPQAADAPEGG